MITVPVLEIGGTHVTAATARICTSPDDHAAVIIGAVRGPIPADGSAEEIAAAIAEIVGEHTQHTQLPQRRPGWSVAIPGPFDYQRGVGLFRGVGKFAALDGVDVGNLLQAHAGIKIANFVNDADAFGLGEYRAGAGSAADPSVYLTLGTGVGSAFIRAGVCVHDGPDVPPGGHAYRIMVDGVPLEDRMSRRAIRAAWRTSTRQRADVAEIAGLADHDHRAEAIFADAYDVLARGLAGYLRAFDARAVIIGGSIARTWWLIEEHLVPALRRLGCDLAVRPAGRGDEAPLIGAAWSGLSAADRCT